LEYGVCKGPRGQCPIVLPWRAPTSKEVAAATAN
jgi:hypothetical protein